MYKFTTNQMLIDNFVSSSNANKILYDQLGDKIFGLKLTNQSAMHFHAVDKNSNRIYDEFDYDFNKHEVNQFIVKTDELSENDEQLVEWVKKHNHGELSFDKALAMYRIAKGE